MIESFDNTANNSPENGKENSEDVRSEREQSADSNETPEAKQTPEFNEERIDRVRLKAAIDIAQEGSTAPEQFKKEKNVYFRDMDESELRNEVRRAEKGGNELEVLELEKLILGREKKNNPSTGLGGEDATLAADSRENPEKKREANGNEPVDAQESVNQETPEEKTGLTGSYSERLSALAKEKDPLGLARVALQETLQELGVTEATYMKAGPFEQLVAADKLEVVRDLEAFKEKTRRNTEISEKDHAIHLKGLIYNKIGEEPVSFEENIREQRADEVLSGDPEEHEVPEESEEAEISDSVQGSPQDELSIDRAETPVAETKEEQQEDPGEVRQRNKIIKIIESDNLDFLDQRLVAVSDRERSSFFDKVREGKITEETLDNDVVRNIAAPFSKNEGVQALHQRLREDERLLRHVGDVIREGLYDTDAVKREGWQPSTEDLGRFIEKYPTPLAFDTTFIADRLQELETALKQETTASRRDLLERGISLLRQNQKQKYPRLRDTLYGKRNEYWEQAKLLLKEARGNETELSEKREETEEELPVLTEEVQPQDKKEVEGQGQAPSPEMESVKAEESIPAELSELKESALLENVLRTLRESVHEHLKTATGYEDSIKIERAMSFFDQQVKNIFSDDKEGVRARGFVSESLRAFLSDSSLLKEERGPYKKVLDLLSEEGSPDSFD